MDFYKGLRVCVTGGAGFLGSHLVDLLVAAGAEVFVLDNFSRGKNTNDKAVYIKGDAGNEADCEWAFRGGETGVGRPVDVVFNLAATVGGVEHNMAHGYDMFLDNVRLQVMPVKVAEKLGIPGFLQVSSACIYSPLHNHPAREGYGSAGEPHHANYGYGWAKRMGEKMAQQSSIEKVVIVRPSNLYGPRDYFDDKAHVIPSLIRQYHEGKARLIGDGSARREFLYVTDAARAVAHLVPHPSPLREVYNLGTSGYSSSSILGLHKMINSIMYPDGLIEQFQVSDHHNPENERWSDCTLLEATGWNYQVTLEEGIKRTVEWYLEQH
jgi:nucleoside-diphosphate-sugar epimerase